MSKPADDKTNRKPYHEAFAEEVIAHLKAGTAPWQKPWDSDHVPAPHNPLSGAVYRGSNRIKLAMSGFDDPRWMTYQQANREGLTIKAGSKGTPIVYWQFTKQGSILDENGKLVLDTDGKAVQREVELERPMMRGSYVFNGSQIEGLPAFEHKDGIKYQWEPEEKAESILQKSGAIFLHDQPNKASYNHAKDEIHLPAKESFPAPEKYYATALHELGHWTGHATRQNRKSGPFGSELYAKEELRAEIASWMVSQDLGIKHEPGQHAAYVQSWVKVLEDDPYEIVRACRDAEKIKEHVMGLEVQKGISQDMQAEKAFSVAENYLRQSVDGQGYKIGIEMLTIVKEGMEHEYPPPAGVAAIALNNLIHPVERAKESAREDLVALIEQHIGIITPGKNSEKPSPGYEVLFGDHDLLKKHPKSIQDAIISADKAHNAACELSEHTEKSYQSIIKAIDIYQNETAKTTEEIEQKTATEKTFLVVPFKEKNLAKDAGAKWDTEAKLWFAPEGANMNILEKWLPEKVVTPENTMPAPAEFALAIKEAGLELCGQLPIMDGNIHRIPAIGGSLGNKDGVYIGHLDGNIPAGFVQNHRTGEKFNWKATGHVLTEEQKQAQRLEITQKQQERAVKIKLEQDEAAKRSIANFDSAAATIEHPYLEIKNVESFGLKKNQTGDLLIPIRNINGDIRGLQAINAEGKKLFASGMEKLGNFHTIAADKDFSKGEILIAEGYATGASLHMATGQPVAVAFDASNLKEVALALRDKFPNASIIICADNDHKAMRNNEPYNVGVEKAKEAALAVAGKVLIPSLNKVEMEQGMTDFNDLHKSRGLKEVKKQVEKGLKMDKQQGMELAI